VLPWQPTAANLDWHNIETTIAAMEIQHLRNGIWERWWLDFVKLALLALKPSAPEPPKR
jgi:hypothetical protein